MGVWRKTLQYLGLVEDEELDDLDDEAGDLPSHRAEPATVRRVSRSDLATVDRPESAVRTVSAIRTSPNLASIHRAEPKRFNEAREIGERFRQGIPVIMNLQAAEDGVARRLVDFAEIVAQRVYLLTPANLEVSAEEREQLVEGGFFNQF